MEINCCCTPKPCPNCGACPCCGRGYGFVPYQPYYPQPIWFSAIGGYVPSTTTGFPPLGTTVTQTIV